MCCRRVRRAQQDRQVAVGDIVVAVNGQRAEDHTLPTMLAASASSSITVITVLRRCSEHDLQADMPSQDDEAPAPSVAAAVLRGACVTETNAEPVATLSMDCLANEGTVTGSAESTPELREKECQPEVSDSEHGEHGEHQASSLSYASTLVEIAQQQDELIAVMARARALLDGSATTDDAGTSRDVASAPLEAPSAQLEVGRILSESSASCATSAADARESRAAVSPPLVTAKAQAGDEEGPVPFIMLPANDVSSPGRDATDRSA